MDMPGSSCEGSSSEHLLVRPGRRPKRKTRGGESRRPTSTTRSPIHCRHFPNGRARFSKNAAMPSLKISYRRRGDPAITLGLEQHVEGSGRRLMHEPLDRRIGQGRPLGDPAGQRLNLLDQFVGRHHAIDQAERQCGFGIHWLAQVVRPVVAPSEAGSFSVAMSSS